MIQQISIRRISTSDDAVIAHIIRTTLSEFGAAKPGTVYYDEATDRLSEVFDKAGSTYYIAEYNGIIVGGAGIYPTDGLGDGTCELVKMYLMPAARGSGLGRMLMDKCIDFAINAGYKQIYLETMPELRNAIKLYEKVGFERLSTPIGASGHFGCDIWMVRKMQINP